MTNLTEQWKKGELPEGWYYVKDEDGQIIIAEYYAESIDRETNETECVWSCLGEPEQVLGQVPSYQDYERLNWYAGDGVEGNAKLKELLKLAKSSVSYHCALCREYTDGQILLSKINQVLGEE